MRRSSPRRSSRTRLRVLAGLAVACCALGAITTGLMAGALALLVVILLDAVLFLFARAPGPDDVELGLIVRAESTDGGIRTGGTLALECRVENIGRADLSLEIVPLVPAGLSTLDGGAGHVRLPVGTADGGTFRYRVDRVGVIVFPGVLARRWSLLRLFRRARLLVDRTEVTVLPDFSNSSHPIVSRFLRADAPGGDRPRGRAIRGQGTEFCELRGYLPHDSMRRVDWKATARRGRLLVREFEDPPEYTIRVILDGSTDLTEGEAGRDAFAHAADLVGKLAYVAALRSMKLVLSMYDRTLIMRRTMDGRGATFRRLLAEVVEAPRRARMRRLATRSAADVTELARRAFRSTMSGWLGGEDFRSFLARYQGATGAPDPAAFLVDVDPGFADLTADICPRCGEPLFPDEAGCPACGEAGAPGALPARAACLADLLSRTLRESRGREMLVLVSSFRGGEASPLVANLLALAATGYRRVHVVMPTHRQLLNDRAELPGSMGTYASSSWILGDLDRLEEAERMREFLDRIRAAGVETHPIEDGPQLEDLVARLLVSEVLSA